VFNNFLHLQLVTKSSINIYVIAAFSEADTEPFKPNRGKHLISPFNITTSSSLKVIKSEWVTKDKMSYT